MRIALVFVLLALTACAPSVDGSLAGREVKLIHAVQGKFTADNGIAWIMVSDSETLCDDLTKKRKRKSSTLLSLALARSSGGSSFAGTSAGTYPAVKTGVAAPEGNFMRTALLVFDADCKNLATDTSASSGEVKTNAELAPGKTVSGELKLNWDDGSHVEGTFSAEPCSAQLPLETCE
jgi:hypothetical protein